MAKIEVDRNVLVSARFSPEGSAELSPRSDGVVAFEVIKDGVRVRVLFGPEEAFAMGVALIRAGEVVVQALQAEIKPASPLVINGGRA
jgi:hypothetical protein